MGTRGERCKQEKKEGFEGGETIETNWRVGGENGREKEIWIECDKSERNEGQGRGGGEEAEGNWMIRG